MSGRKQKIKFVPIVYKTPSPPPVAVTDQEQPLARVMSIHEAEQWVERFPDADWMTFDFKKHDKYGPPVSVLSRKQLFDLQQEKKKRT